LAFKTRTAGGSLPSFGRYAPTSGMTRLNARVSLRCWRHPNAAASPEPGPAVARRPFRGRGRRRISLTESNEREGALIQDEQWPLLQRLDLVRLGCRGTGTGAWPSGSVGCNRRGSRVSRATLACPSFARPRCPSLSRRTSGNPNGSRGFLRSQDFCSLKSRKANGS
jgi:hypothetical protein